MADALIAANPDLEAETISNLFAANDGIVAQRMLLQARLHRPKNWAQFSYMLNVWLMLCHAAGMGTILAIGAFLIKIVYEQIEENVLTWQQSHELLLLYLETLETQPANAQPRLTFGNVFESGGQDFYRERAKARALEHFKSAPSGPGPEAGLGSFRPTGKPKADHVCYAFNAGKRCPKSSCDPSTGKCQYAHVCNQFVSEQPDGTPGGICGSTKHGRHQCDNPKKTTG